MAVERDSLIREFQRDRLRLIAYIRALTGDAALAPPRLPPDAGGAVARAPPAPLRLEPVDARGRPEAPPHRARRPGGALPGPQVAPGVRRTARRGGAVMSTARFEELYEGY